MVALTCESFEDTPTNNVIAPTTVKEGPVCGGNPDFCVPKCCPSNELFHVGLLR